MPEHYINVFVGGNYSEPPLEQQKSSGVPPFLDKLNDSGLIAYHIKCLIALIDHFGYDYEDWREVMELLTDLTLMYGKSYEGKGLRSASVSDCEDKLWLYKPSEILEPVGIPQKGTNKYIVPCDVCGRTKYHLYLIHI